jgi:hypothetical protein
MKINYFLLGIFLFSISCSNTHQYADDELDYISSKNSDCSLKDDIYEAEIEYHNPETGYSKNYTLEVEIEDCYVVKINWPNGGWLDESHITPDKIDDTGNVLIEGENGKTYDIHVDYP